jgi:hypothetical protein
MNMKKLNVTLAILVAAVMAGNAQTVTSDIVGYQKINLPPGGKPVAPTFIKSNVFQGSATISGSTVTVSTGALSGLSLGPTAFSNRANYPKYYAEITDPNSQLYGYNFDVSAANTASAFTSDNIPVGLSGSVKIAIRPHVTLADLNPASLADGDGITMANDPTGGQGIFYVFNGGWIGSDFDTTKDFSHVIIPPGVGFVYSAQSSDALTLTLVGTVKNTPTAVPVYQNAYANIVGAINPSTSINYSNQGIATGIGSGAAFTKYSDDGSFTEQEIYYSLDGGLLNGAFSPVSTANIAGGEAVTVSALDGDKVWLIPAAIAVSQ